jgi:GAF domain-containing protein
MADLPTEGRIRRLSIRFQSVVADRDSDLTIALIALIARAGADVTVVYRLDAEAGQFHAVARQASSPEYIPDFEVTLSVSASQRLEGLTEPVQGKTSQNVLFEELPEIIRRGLGRTLVVPILGVEGLLGIVTLGQPADRDFDANAVALAQRSARLLAGSLERDSLQQKLLERKLIERAKGILQARRGVSENQAYLSLRSESRRRRVSMVDLAREIVETQFRGPGVKGFRGSEESVE